MIYCIWCYTNNIIFLKLFIVLRLLISLCSIKTLLFFWEVRESYIMQLSILFDIFENWITGFHLILAQILSFGKLPSVKR